MGLFSTLMSSNPMSQMSPEMSLNFQDMLSNLSGSGFSQGGMMSDEDAKKNKIQDDEMIQQFLDHVAPYQYEYKDKSMGEGKKYGVMAQDLEKSKVGETLVRDTPRGKMVDMNHSMGVTLAALGYIHNRLKKLEGKKNA